MLADLEAAAERAEQRYEAAHRKVMAKADGDWMPAELDKEWTDASAEAEATFKAYLDAVMRGER